MGSEWRRVQSEAVRGREGNERELLSTGCKIESDYQSARGACNTPTDSMQKDEDQEETTSKRQRRGYGEEIREQIASHTLRDPTNC